MKIRMPALLMVLLLTLIACRPNDSKKKNGPEPHLSTQSNPARGTFVHSVIQLQTGRIDSLVLHADRTIKVNPLGKDLSEITAREGETGTIVLGDYKSLQKSDVLKIDDNYALVILHDRYSDQIRAATFSLDGEPLEAILLFSTIGNNDYKISRSYSYRDNIPYQYDPQYNRFIFSDLRYDTEWIEYPVKGHDTLTYQVDFVVKINDRGGFEKVESVK